MTETRYFIVGTGRSGSSLLAAILSDAGAAFDMESGGWDREAGDFEHPLVHRAESLMGWLERRRTRGAFSKTAARSLGQKLAREIVRLRFKRVAKSLMDRARFVKGSHLVWLVQPIARLGYKPVVLVSYRRFAGYAASRYRRSNLPLRELAEAYVATYETALLQLGVYGGCAVSYEELVDPAENAWAERLAAVTGLSSETLLKARAERVRDLRPQPALAVSDARAEDMERRLDEAGRQGPVAA